MSLIRSVIVVVMLASFARADPAVWLYPTIGRPHAVRVAGLVLKEAPKQSSTTITKNLRRLAASQWAGAAVSITLEGRRAETITDDDGGFEVTFGDPAIAGGPFPPGLHAVTVSVAGASAIGSIEVVADAAPFLVVSDFDDTVAITNVVSKRGLVKAVLFEDSDTQPPVPGMSAFYACLRRAPGGPGLAFVSGSPVEFVPRVLGFLEKQGFPFAGLYLRELGPTTLSGYKQPILRRLLTEFTAPVVFVGDSGEHDPEIYAQLRREFPGRVRRIYIRDAGRAQAGRFTDMLLFKDAREAALDAVALGLADRSCVEAAFPGAPPSGTPR